MTREEYLKHGLEIGLLKFSEYLELTKPLNLPEGLEEAAENYAHSLGYDEDKDKVEIAAAKDDFIAGAEWDRAKMMEKAVETEVVSRITGSGLLPSVTFLVDDSCKEGDKVKIIIIPEEK